MKVHTLQVAIVGLTAIGIVALWTGHDSETISSIIGAILVISGYAISKRSNGNNGQSQSA